MLERQSEGMAKAKADGKCMGRKPTAFEKAEDVRRMLSEGVNPTDIASKLDIGRASVYRIMNADPERNGKMSANLRRWKAREKGAKA